MTVDQIPITRFSIITRISPKALRYYDRKGLLVPAAKDSLTGYRYYTADQLEQGVQIKTLCILGFSMDEITGFLDAEACEDHVAIEDMLSQAALQDAKRDIQATEDRGIAQEQRQGVDEDGLD